MQEPRPVSRETQPTASGGPAKNYHAQPGGSLAGVMGRVVRLRGEFVRQRIRHQTGDPASGPSSDRRMAVYYRPKGAVALGGEAAGGARPLAPVGNEALLHFGEGEPEGVLAHHVGDRPLAAVVVVGTGEDRSTIGNQLVGRAG